MPENQFTPEELALLSEAQRRAEKMADGKLSKINWLIGGVILVLFVGFLTMLIALGGVLYDAFTFRSSSYHELSSQVEELNDKFDDQKENLNSIETEQKSNNETSAVEIKIPEIIKLEINK